MKKSGKETPVRLANSGQMFSNKKVEVDAFVHLCNKHSITPTKRQLSKYRNKKGKLFKAVNGVK